MAFALGKTNNRGIVGLDVDGQFLAAVQASSDGVSRAVSSDLPPGIISDGEVTDVPALSEALKDFFKAHNLPKRVRLGVSNQQIVVRHLELPKIEDAEELAAAVRFQASEAIAMPLDEGVLDHQVIGETITPEGAARHRIVVVAARQSIVTRVVQAGRAGRPRRSPRRSACRSTSTWRSPRRAGSARSCCRAPARGVRGWQTSSAR